MNFAHDSSKIFKEIAPKTFYRAVDKSGLNQNVTDRRQRVVFHTLRHTFASWLVQKGVHLSTIGQLLGHTSMKMTMRYAHLDPTKQTKNAVSCIDDEMIKITNIA